MVAAVTRSSDEQQRALLELCGTTPSCSARRWRKGAKTYAVRCQLIAMQQQQQQHHSGDAMLGRLPDEADDDDVEEKELELQELRRWKRLFVAVQTSDVMERMEQLTARVNELEEQQAQKCNCCARKSSSGSSDSHSA